MRTTSDELSKPAAYALHRVASTSCVFTLNSIITITVLEITSDDKVKVTFVSYAHFTLMTPGVTWRTSCTILDADW